MALTSHYSGQEKWEQELKTQDDTIHTWLWKGKRNFSLEKFIQQNRNTLVSMKSCAEYFHFQLPTELTQVGYILSGIQWNDARLQAATTSVQIDTSTLGNRNSFEATATHILPYDTVSKKRTSNKRGSSDISDTSKVEVSSFGTKAGIGKTGCYIQYQKPPEYATLSKDQK